MTEFITSAILLGAIATALMDAFCFVREALFKTPAPNYAPVGRWIVWSAHGTVIHRNIAETPKVKGELLIGWLTHYTVGIAFAALLLAIFGLDWLAHPTLIPALIIGIGSVAAPFLIMQPAMGSGVAASKTPNPTAARIRSLILHTVFGVALYVAGWVVALEVADRLKHVANAVELKKAESSLSALEEVADKLGRAFSGSWLGYHANVYYLDFSPPPPGAHFSREWGSKELLGGSFGSRGDWREFDPEEVKEYIRQSARNPNLKAVSKAADNASKTFLSLKSDIISIISMEIASSPDPYLERLKAEIENFVPMTSFDVASHWSPKGQIITRDMVAAGQGSKIPPHISIKAEVVSIRFSFDLCKSAAGICEKAASHLQRKFNAAKKVARIGTNVFIGHGRAAAWREVKDFISSRLKLPWDEFNRVPVAGVTNIARLSEMLDAACIAFIIMTAEDETADGKLQARMNVIHEAGLFQGRLGFTKAIILVEDGCEEFSNIQGLGQIRFPEGRISAAFEEIRMVLEREGVLEGGVD